MVTSHHKAVSVWSIDTLRVRETGRASPVRNGVKTLREKKENQRVGLPLLCFTRFSSANTHTLKKKKILTSHCTAWLVRLLVTVITILQPWCKQRERRGDFSEWTDGKYFSLLSSSYLRDYYNKHKYEFNTLINYCFLPICPFPTFFFFVSPFCSLNL